MDLWSMSLVSCDAARPIDICLRRILYASRAKLWDTSGAIIKHLQDPPGQICDGPWQ
jgi:hypothetical protein